MDGSRRLLLLALAVLGVGVLVAVLMGGDEGPKSELDAAGGGAQDGTSGSLRGADGVAGDGSRALRGADAAEVPDGVGAASRDAMPPLAPERRESLLAEIERMGEALSVEREVEETETEEEEQVREAAWSAMIDRLIQRVRSDPRQAQLMLETMDGLEDEAHAIRLARILRRANHPAFVAAMVERATTGGSPMKRRTALLTLEARDAKVWMEPVSRAYTHDADASVRDEAAGVLQRSLIDRKHFAVHGEVRDTIQSGFEADDPATRVRALNAMLGDRRATPRDIDRIKALTKDADPSVRAAATRALRILEPRTR